jgi:hypothetical protein
MAGRFMEESHQIQILLISALAELRVVSFMAQMLSHQGKSTTYPLDRRLGGPQNRSEETACNAISAKRSQPVSKYDIILNL